MNFKPVAIEDLYPQKDNLLRVEWNLGKRCNFDCSYCGSSTHDKVSPHLDSSTIDKTLIRLSELGRKSGKAVKLAFTGGEPFLHPNFLDVLDRAHELGISKISVTTNGSFPARTYEQALTRLSHLIVSYHMEYAKRERVLQNIEELHDLIFARRKTGESRLGGLHVHVMLLPGEFEEAERVVARLKERGIEYAVRRIRPQFAEDGDYLRPFNSGLVGRVRGGKTPPPAPYYTRDEMRRMEAGF